MNKDILELSVQKSATKRVASLVGAAFVLAVLLFAIGLLYQNSAVTEDNRNFPPPGKLVDVGGRSLHMVVSGDGPYTVVLEAGSGGTSLDWTAVQSGLTAFARVCAYDRAGYGWSDPGNELPTPLQLVSDLHRLLTAGDLKPPYILVGHSFGGFIVSRFAAEYPDETGGVVLVDALHEDFFNRMPPVVRENSEAQLRMISIAHKLCFTGIPRLFFSPIATQGLPPEIQSAANARGFRASVYKALYDEATAFSENPVWTESNVGFPRNIPLVVLSRGDPEQWPPSVPTENAEAVWRELQTSLAGQSDDCTHTVVDDSGHFIQVEKPEIVIGAVKGLLEKLSGYRPHLGLPK